jgi:SOS-response transcriptional repressor LexA
MISSSQIDNTQSVAFSTGLQGGLDVTTQKDLDSPAARLRDARKRAGYRSATQAAKALGVVVTTYRTHENGDRALLPDAASHYGKSFSVSPAWLLYGMTAPESERRIPVVGSVGVGAEVKMQANETDTIPAPPGLTGEANALRVLGSSLYPRFQDGDTLIYGQRVTYERAQGRECVVGLADEAGEETGEILVRRVGPVARGGEVLLESSNAPSISRRAAWYAPVEWVRPA